MNDLFIFAGGCFVSLLVAGAVSLLLWGAVNEPEYGEAPESEPQKDSEPGSKEATSRTRTSRPSSPREATSPA